MSGQGIPHGPRAQGARRRRAPANQAVRVSGVRQAVLLERRAQDAYASACRPAAVPMRRVRQDVPAHIQSAHSCPVRAPKREKIFVLCVRTAVCHGSAGQRTHGSAHRRPGFLVPHLRQGVPHQENDGRAHKGRTRPVAEVRVPGVRTVLQEQELLGGPRSQESWPASETVRPVARQRQF